MLRSPAISLFGRPVLQCPKCVIILAPLPQAAAYLGISEITLQVHRANAMRKMKAQSLAELVSIADALEMPLATVRRQPEPFG
jgi:hypothetical protein